MKYCLVLQDSNSSLSIIFEICKLIVTLLVLTIEIHSGEVLIESSILIYEFLNLFNTFLVYKKALVVISAYLFVYMILGLLTVSIVRSLLILLRMLRWPTSRVATDVILLLARTESFLSSSSALLKTIASRVSSATVASLVMVLSGARWSESSSRSSIASMSSSITIVFPIYLILFVQVVVRVVFSSELLASFLLAFYRSNSWA